MPRVGLCWWPEQTPPTRSPQIPRLQAGVTVLTFSVDNRVGKGGLFLAPETGSCISGARWEWRQGAPCCLWTVLLGNGETCGFGLFSEVQIFIFPPALFMYYYIWFSFPTSCLLLGCFSFLGGIFFLTCLWVDNGDRTVLIQLILRGLTFVLKLLKMSSHWRRQTKVLVNIQTIKPVQMCIPLIIVASIPKLSLNLSAYRNLNISSLWAQKQFSFKVAKGRVSNKNVICSLCQQMLLFELIFI